MTTILITGSKGFIAKNLIARLHELNLYKIIEFNKDTPLSSLAEKIHKADIIFHLAGENRPKNISDFKKNNIDLTKEICSILKLSKKKIPIIFSSSIHVKTDNEYGISKLKAEELIKDYSMTEVSSAMIYRLPGVFGKWCKPNYNSVIATFCHNLANDLPVKINDTKTKLNLVYIDDVIDSFISNINNISIGLTYPEVQPLYTQELGQIVSYIKEFANTRENLVIEKVGKGFIRALYSTYLSYLPARKFIYDLSGHSDERGIFVEMLKTKDSGQFSFFTAHPGITRGGHYHHTKTEKFLVIKGLALFKFKDINSGDRFEIRTSGELPQVVETIPGWSHDITNIGDTELIVMLWANEVFNIKKPDTINHKL